MKSHEMMNESGKSQRAAPAERRAVWRARAAWGACLLAIVGYYWFFISAGRFSPWPDSGHYYDTQAEGFRSGHLYTTVQPNPDLLRLPNPYAYEHRDLWAWDYSLYRGHLYLYWGLLPAAGLALVKSLLRLDAPVNDGALVFAFLCLRLLAGAALIRALARHFTPAPPRWAVGAALLVFALAHPTPFVLARPAIYEAALTGGACFAVCAYYFAFRWLCGPSASGLRWLCAASACFGLAGTTRASLLPAAALFTLLLFARGAVELGPQLWRALSQSTPSGAIATRPALWSLLRCGAAAFLPFSALALAHLVVNHLRFDSWKEFGVSYQLGVPFDIGPRFAIANLWNYLFHPWHVSCRFPFLLPRWHEMQPMTFHMPSFIPVPEGYVSHEPLAGLLVSIPFCGLLLVFPARRLWARWRGASVEQSAQQRSAWRWFQWLVLVVTLVSSVPVLMLFTFSMRYKVEFASGVLLLACLAGWRWLALPRSRAGQLAARAGYLGLALLTILLAVPMGLTGYYDWFQTHNRPLYARLQEALSTCPPSQGGCPTTLACPQVQNDDQATPPVSAR